MRDLRWEFDMTIKQLRETKRLPEQTIQGIEANLKKIAAVIDENRGTFEQAKQSNDLTAEGLGNLKHKLDAEAKRKLQNIKSSFALLDANIRQVAASIPALGLPAPENPVLAFLQEQEVRASLAGKDRLELEIYYETHAMDDPLLAAAMENAPRRLLSPEVIAAMRVKRGRKANPEACLRLEELQFIRGRYTEALGAAATQLGTEDSEITIL